MACASVCVCVYSCHSPDPDDTLIDVEMCTDVVVPGTESIIPMDSRTMLAQTCCLPVVAPFLCYLAKAQTWHEWRWGTREGSLAARLCVVKGKQAVGDGQFKRSSRIDG